MNRIERDLEKALKRLLKGERVPPNEIVSRWKELGGAGSRLMVALMNRTPGWVALAESAMSDPAARDMLEGLAQYPGISGEGLAVLETSGIPAPQSDAPSRRALWITEVASREATDDFPRAQDMLLSSREMLDATLSLLEAQPSENKARFLSSTLSRDLSEDQDQLIRKSLYRLKQHGFAVEDRKAAGVAETEWWALSENRDPHIQFGLCFRFHSAFSNSGDLYTIRVWEGKEVFPVSQERDLQMSPTKFEDLYHAYSHHLEQQLRLELPIHSVPREQAVFFMRKSMSLLPEGANAKPLLDLLRFLGAGGGEDPFAGKRPSAEGLTASLLDHPYFVRWIIDPDDLKDYFEEEKKLEEGPIILVGAPQMEQKRSAAEAGLKNYFDERRRRLWGFFFEKASYFLQKSEPDIAVSALKWTRAFEDLSIPIDQLDAAKILFERTVQLHKKIEEQRKKEESETSLIMTPEQFARSQKPSGR